MRSICDDCGICCLETEMIISIEDIEKIIGNSQEILKKEDFMSLNNEGFFQLKNINGRCVFFNKTSKLCNIYRFRPQGCRFYPLIYSFNKKTCLFDDDCPRTNLFYQNKKELKKTCKEIKKFLKKELFVKI